MGHTNSTTNYSLPQFVTTDKPAWLTDINGAFSTIDTAIDAAKDAADAAQSDATDALTAAGTAGTAAATADAKGAGAVASIANAFDATSTYAVGDLVMYNNLLYTCTTAVTTPGAWTGVTNWSRTTVETVIPANAGQIPLGSSTPSGSTAKAIDDLKNERLFVGSNVSGSTVSIAANGWADSLITIPTIAGYTPLCFVNVHTSSPTNLVIAGFNIEGTPAIRIRNLSNSTQNAYGLGRVIYIKSSHFN